MQFPPKKTRVAFGLQYRVELFYFGGMPVERTDGRAGRTYGHATTSIYQHFLDAELRYFY